jgi:hypothetical protein
MANTSGPLAESPTCQNLDWANNPLAKAFKNGRIEFIRLMRLILEI